MRKAIPAFCRLTTTMNKERLLRLADYMENVDAKRYNQDSWATNVIGPPENFEPYIRAYYSSSVVPYYQEGSKVLIPDLSCGSTMCVLGHAVNAFPDSGMFFYATIKHEDIHGELLRAGGVTILGMVNGELKEGAELASNVFDIPYDDACIMFGGSDGHGTYAFYTDRDPEEDYCSDEGFEPHFNKVTPKVVAQRLREYVNTDGSSMDYARQHEYR